MQIEVARHPLFYVHNVIIVMLMLSVLGCVAKKNKMFRVKNRILTNSASYFHDASLTALIACLWFHNLSLECIDLALGAPVCQKG